MNRTEHVQTVCGKILESSCYDIDERDFVPPSRNNEIFRLIGLLSVIQTRLLEGLTDEDLSEMVLSVTKNLVVYHACCLSSDTLD